MKYRSRVELFCALVAGVDEQVFYSWNRRTKGTTVFWHRVMYRTGSEHGLGCIGEAKVRPCFCIGSGGTWIGPDTKTSTATRLIIVCDIHVFSNGG